MLFDAYWKKRAVTGAPASMQDPGSKADADDATLIESRAARPQNRAHTITKNSKVGIENFGKFQKATGPPASWHSEGLSGHPVAVSPG